MDVYNINIDKICRICLLEGSSMISVFSKLLETEILEVDVCTLAEELVKITGIDVNKSDGFPLQVCSDCVRLIHAAYKFKKQFDDSYSILQRYISICSQKEEIGELVTDKCDNNDEDLSLFEQIDGQPTKAVRKKKLLRRCRRKTKFISKNKDLELDSEKDILLQTKLYPCPICTKQLPALELREHAHSHAALKKYLNIPVSQRVSKSTKFYHKHDPTKEVASIHNRPVKLHECILCDAKLPALDFRSHIENHRNQKEYKCDQCDRVFRKLNHLNTHRVKHLKEFPFKCEQCGKGFVIEKNYDCHMLTHNVNQELPHECTHCLKRFSNPEHLNRHVIIHTENVSYSVKYRVCKCHHCLKTFQDRDELKKHVCNPIKQNPSSKYPCTSCNKIFKNSSGLYNHNRSVHKLKGAKVLCSVCGKYVSNIYNHMMRHTGEKPYQCNQCGKRFSSKPQLKQHLLVHSGLKPYVCSVCAKAFNNLYNLQVHERIHKGDRCHICNICSKGFLEKSYLKKHMNVHRKV